MKKEENFIVFSDILQLIYKTKWIILAGALVFGTIGFYKRSQIPVKHKVMATFKEGRGSSNPSMGGMFESILHTIGVSEKMQQGHVLLNSSLILEPVIQKLGLQAAIHFESPFNQKVSLLKNALRAERGIPIEKPSMFEFKNIHYLGEETLNHTLFFTSINSFEIRNNDGYVLSEGSVGFPLSFDGITLTLNEVPKNLKLHFPYLLAIASMEEAVITYRKKIEVEPLKGDQSILEIKFYSDDRHRAKTFLNTLMGVYEKYLRAENHRISEEQLLYLEKRRSELCEKMGAYLESHVTYLKENLKEKGTLTLGQQLPVFHERKRDFTNELLSLDQKLAKLTQKTPLLTAELGREVHHLQESLHHSVLERDELNLALLQGNTQDQEREKCLKALDVIDRHHLRAKTGVGTFFSKLSQSIQNRDRLLLETSNFGKILSPDANQLQKVQKEKKELIQIAKEKKWPEFTENYFQNTLRLLSLQEGVLKQRLSHGIVQGESYRGVDLKTARQLLIEYLQKRDECRSKISQMEFAKGELEKEGAELISLAGAFPDPLCQEMVGEMGRIRQTVRKEKSLTEKEIERLKRKEKEFKNNLSRHTEQILALTHLEEERMEKHIRSVQIALIDLIGQEITLIEKQVEDRIDEELIHLKLEKELISKQLQGVLKEMEDIPDAWLKEHELTFSADMNRGILEALVQLIESKSIESNLMTIESKPIDAAYAPLRAKPPLLRVFGVIGALLGGLITFMFCFAYYLRKGIPLSLQNMGVRGKIVLGKLSKKENIEIFRKFSHVIKEKNSRIVTLLLGKGKDYSFSLAELLAKEGKKICVIDLDFSKKEKNLSGLLDFLEGKIESPSIIKKEFGDYVPMGGNTPFGNEMIKGERFAAFLKNIKEMYDVVFLAVPQRTERALPKTLFSCAHLIAICLGETSFEALTPYFEWEKQGNSLVFVS